MKHTTVDEDGNVKCPACGAINSFTAKRTGKAKALGVATVGVGVLAMPKRLRCNGCGANLKASPSVEQRRERTAATREETASLKEIRDDVTLTPEERAATYGNPLDRAIARRRLERQARKAADAD